MQRPAETARRSIYSAFRARQIFAGPGTVTGHASAGGAGMADVEFLNREAGAFLDGVTEGGKKLN
jgi:hypothetical protein